MSKDLEVRHCRVLLAVKENGGIAAAARALGVAQSTVSEALLSLERILGAAVVQRRPGGGAGLTAVGDALLPHAHAIVSASEAALATVAANGREVVRLGTVESISSFVLPRPLQEFREHHPRVDVQITIGLCEDLRKRVRRHELDAAITIEGVEQSSNDDGVWSRTLSQAELKLVASRANIMTEGRVERATLATQTFLLADPGGAFNGLMQGWFEGAGRRPRFESAGSIDGVKRGVQNSDAIGVLPRYAVAGELASGALAEVRPRERLPAIALLVTTLERPLESSSLHALIGQVGDLPIG